MHLFIAGLSSAEGIFMDQSKWAEHHNQRPGIWLRANFQSWVRSNKSIDAELDEVSVWCLENQCGLRMSYDLWRFKNEEQLTFFLLKWS